MTYKNQILLGRIIKVNSYEGTVSVRLEKSFVDNLPQMESVFLEVEGKPVPFFISWSGYRGGDLLKLRFESYNTFEKLKILSGCNVYLTKIPGNYKPANNFQEIIGFKIIGSRNEITGTITDIISYPGQDLLTVLTPSGKEILVPVHEDLIAGVDKKKKIIIMNLPEGLTGIN